MSELIWTKGDGLAWADDEAEMVRYRVVRDKRQWYVEVCRIEEMEFSDGESMFVLADPAGRYLMAEHVRTQDEGIRWSKAYLASRDALPAHDWLRVGAAWGLVWESEDAENTSENVS
jgi:hypothetical protein